MRGKYSGLEVTEKSRQPRRSAPYVTTETPTRSARLLFLFSKEANNYDFKFACLLCEYPVRNFRAYSYRRYSAVQPAGFGKIGMTIEEAADYTGIGRNTLRRLVDWEKIPVMRIGRKSASPCGCDLLFLCRSTRAATFWTAIRSLQSGLNIETFDI